MVTIIVDDRDPSVTHSGSWRGFSDDLAYNDTLTWLGTAGTAKISFIGSGIGVHGTNYADSSGKQLPPECLYTIDEGTPVRLIVNRTATTTWGDLFFQSPELPKSSHVLTIEYADNHRIKDVLVLDYFIVNDGTLPSDPSSSLSTPLPSPTTTTPFTTPNSPVLSPSSSYSTESSSSFSTLESSLSFPTLESSSSSWSPTSGATPTSLATDLVQVKTMTKLPIGPIIGGALGALTLICTVLLILYLRRRRQEGHSNKIIGAPPRAIGRPQISPYNILQHPQDDGRGKPFVDTKTGTTGMAATQVLVTTSSVTAETIQRTAQQALAGATSPSTLASRMVPIPEDIDPPPSYLQR